jgi:chromosome segregation ATPase
MLHHDIACKGQANKELMKTVTSLKKKNKDHTQKISELTLAIDEFVISKNETTQKISALEDDLSVKKSVIEEISAESCNKDKLLEEKTAQNDHLSEQLRRSNAKNEELKLAIHDLVASNKEQMTQITVLRDDVAVKTSMADKMSMEISEWRTKCEDKVTENVAVTAKLEISKVESDVLKETIQDFEIKNANYASELENLMESLQEVVELNGELQSRVEQISAVNDELGEANKVSENKNAELLDVVECLTNSLNDERSAHEAEVDEMNKLMKAEKENHDIIQRDLEETLREVTDRMNDEMLAQKESSDKKIAHLTKSAKEAKVHSDDVSGQNVVLKTKMEKLKKSLASSHKDLASSIGQLEKDLNEEFQITAELKTSAEELILKLNDDKDKSECLDNAEEVLGNLRMIQCWQVSHIQLMHKLVTENKEQVRRIRNE